MAKSAFYNDLSSGYVEKGLNEDAMGRQDWKQQDQLVEGGCSGA